MADFSQEKKYGYNWQSSKFKDVLFEGNKISSLVNDAGYITSDGSILSASFATSASYAQTASYYGGIIASASYATSASYAQTASYYGGIIVSASYATSASHATSASYATNGGVTQLLAGPNITLSPTNGLGQVTINATLSGSTIFNTATGSYGSFYSTQTQTNVASTARSMSLNITDITNGVSISGSTNPYNTYIKTQNAGVYNIQFSAQVDKTDSGTDEIWIWIKKNGTNLTDTATSVQLTGNGAHYVAAWNFFVNAATGDYFQLMWYSPDANVRLHAEPAFGVVPGIPSLIVTVNRIDQFLSNTGSFSGSFTGNLIGTASFATTASYVNNLNQNISISGVTSLGNGTFTKAGSATGDVLLDNNGNDTPGVLFYYANNSNYGIDSWNGSFDVLSGQLVRVTNKLNETGGAVKMALDTSGNAVFTGFVKANAWRAGQVINDIVLSNTEVTISTTTIATSNTDTDFLTYSYTPLSSNSYLVIHYHLASFSFEGGTGNDSYFSRIKIDGTEITYSRQSTVNGNRTGVLFPLTGRYTNSNTTAKSIVVACRRDSADDNITITNSATSMWLRITEIAR